MEFKENELDEILRAHLQKDEKVDIYKPRVLSNIVNGVVNFKATWSWWAFFGTWGFFLYRKMYLQAAVFLLLSILLQSFGAVGLILMVISGVSAFYFYTKKLEKDLQIAGYNQREFSQVLESLKNLGGYHSWVIWVAVILNIIFLFLLVLSLGIIGAASQVGMLPPQ
ncbi:MAG: DUF2628 domain-containing protein [Arcobacter sp.]|nr:DUF2628 domain-containing protein [Arcobacter sp.]